MRNKLSRSYGALKTTALGGSLFLVPIVAIGIALGYVYSIAAGSYQHVKPWIPFDTATGIAVVFCLATLGLLLACFAFGLIAQRAIGRHFTRTIEQQLIKIYPKYAIYKDLLAGKLGGDDNVPSLRPVLVRKEGLLLLAFEADRLASGHVVIYFPGAPDAWTGSLALVEGEQVRPMNLPFSQVIAISERLGRQSSSLLDALDLGEITASDNLPGSLRASVSRASS
jgi:uncharacterized membrane protein